jgi:hypothetical protein
MPQQNVRKLPIRLLIVNGLLLQCLVGCGPLVKRAPFRQRPDTVRVGSLLGPFTGQVIDADTRAPIAGALVSCAWSFERGLGFTAPQGSRTATTRTDVDGRYWIPRLRDFPQGLTSRLARLSLVIYKKRYVAYRHDRVFNQPSRRPSFSQLDNRVTLLRWSPELSHARHLIFIGGGAELEEASRWEIAAAVAELDGKRPAPGSTIAPRSAFVPELGSAEQSVLDARVLLSSDEVRAITGYTGAFAEGRLSDARSGTYDTFHLRAVGMPERYDVAIRLWRLGGAELEAKYEEILNALPGSKQNDEIGDRSFTVSQGEILGLGIMERAASAVLLLTCGRGQCSEERHLLALGERIAKNLQELPPAPDAAGPPDTLEEDEEKQEGAADQDEAADQGEAAEQEGAADQDEAADQGEAADQDEAEGAVEDRDAGEDPGEEAEEEKP